MDMLLVSVTVVSLALATSLAGIAWKLLWDARRFSAHRVEALVALAASESTAASAYSSRIARPRPVRGGFLRVFLIVGIGGAFGAGAIYGTRSSVSAWLATMFDATPGFESASSGSPLELRSLQQTVDDEGNFVVSGTVAAPIDARALENVLAVVNLFDEEGERVANGRASINTTTLHAGEEARFEVQIRTTAHVSRYRVGFRLPDGATVAHVDKRAGSQGLASNKASEH